MMNLLKFSLFAALGLTAITSHAVIGNFGIYPNQRDARTPDSALFCHMSLIKANSLSLKRGPLLVGDANTTFLRVTNSGQPQIMTRRTFQSAALLGSMDSEWLAGGNAVRARGPKGTYLVYVHVPSEAGIRNSEMIDSFVRSIYHKANQEQPVGIQTDSCIIFYEDLVELSSSHPQIVIREE